MQGSGTLVNHTAACGAFTTNGATSPINVTGLTNGTTYTCKVRTATTAGVSAWSANSNAVVPDVAEPAVTYFHNDISGSPMLATDGAGAVIWKENYRPYGERLNNQAGSSKNKLGFAGKQFDPATGLSYMGARYYDPVLGRFMGVDPVGYQEANIHSSNRYAYANNNPYKYVDRNGKYAELVVEAMSLSVGYMSLRENMRAGNTMAAITDGVGMLADIAGAALPGVPGVAGLGIKASREAAERVARQLPDSTIVCRGGTCTSELFTNGSGVTTDAATGMLDGVSTGIGKTVAEASSNIPHKTVGVSTVGAIRAAGGKVVNDRGNHANVSGITAEKAAELFKNVERNPNR